MENKFTKGPWIVLDGAFVYALNDFGVNQFDLTINGHGKRGAGEEELQANAHLIAAAPLLYDEIENEIKLLLEMKEKAPIGNYRQAIINQIERKKALLAKARGELWQQN